MKPTFVLCKRELLPDGKVKVTIHTKDGVHMTYYVDNIQDAYAQARRDYEAGMMTNHHVTDADKKVGE